MPACFHFRALALTSMSRICQATSSMKKPPVPITLANIVSQRKDNNTCALCTRKTDVDTTIGLILPNQHVSGVMLLPLCWHKKDYSLNSIDFYSSKQGRDITMRTQLNSFLGMSKLIILWYIKVSIASYLLEISYQSKDYFFCSAYS